MTRTPSPGEAPDAAAARLARGPIVLVGSRRKMARVAVFSAAFVLVGAWEMRQPGTWHGLPVVAIGAAALALGVLGGAVATLQLVRPPSLTLTARSLEIRTLGRTTDLRWSEVERFEAWRPRARGPAMAGYRRRGPPRTRMEAVARGLGCDGAIPDHFPMSTTALLDLCEACRRRWG